MKQLTLKPARYWRLRDARLDVRFAEQDAKIDLQFTEIKGQFRLVYWMLAVVIASNLIPQLTAFWG